MTELISPLQAILQDSGYQTWLTVIDGREIVGFEDDAVMGFVCVFETVDTLLKDWRNLESKILLKHAHALQRAGEKTWNVYSIFLSSGTATASQLREVRWIEENLEKTRKIAGCQLSSREDLVNTLLPLLPLQYQPQLDNEDFDLRQRLRKRIAGIAANLSDAALDRDVSPAEVVRILGVDV
jgi:hypothetical protein